MPGESPSGYFWCWNETRPEERPFLLEAWERDGVPQGFCHEAAGIVTGVTHWTPATIDPPNSKATDEIEPLQAIVSHWQARFDKLEAERDALRARYEWLKDAVLKFSAGRVEVHEFVAPIAYGYSIDSAIDVALGKIEPQYVDCGECPRISTGCEVGKCLRASEKAALGKER